MSAVWCPDGCPHHWSWHGRWGCRVCTCTARTIAWDGGSMSESIEPCGQVCGIPRAKHQTEEHPWKPWDDFGDQCGGCAHTRGSHANTGSCDFCPCDTFADVTEPVLPPPDYSLMEDAGTG